jgi:hypothetical protein
LGLAIDFPRAAKRPLANLESKEKEKMKRSTLSILIAVVMLLTRFASAGPPSGATWNLILDDEFTSDSGIKTNIWGTGSTGWENELSSSCTLITASDTYLNGSSGLVNKTTSGSYSYNGTTYPYSTGTTYLKPPYWMTYGYIEINAQYPNETGAWPAFWMLQDGWPPEIDIAEYRGAPLSYMDNEFYDDNSTWVSFPNGGDIADTGDSFTGWYTWGLDWEPTSLTFYKDGVVTNTYSGSYIPSTPMYVILSGGVDCSDVNGSGFPNYFNVAYVRWYQKAATAAPSAPTNVTAIAGVGKTTVTWGASGGSPTGYYVLRSTTSGGPYTKVGTVSEAIPTTYTDTTVTTGETYYYVVEAYNGSGTSANSAQSEVNPFPGIYEIENVSSGLALNVSGASTSVGAEIIQYSYSGSTNELWALAPTTNTSTSSTGYYQIVNVNSGLDVVVNGELSTDGGLIVQNSLGTGQNDLWKPTENSDGSYTFTNLHSGLVLEDPGSSTTQGKQMDQYSSNSGSNQHWKLILVN